ncbi:MAG: JAB domain-containing protein [Clostridia bacterium]|nr:JAB domain-containing protein [Clostridia bacterium]
MRNNIRNISLLGIGTSNEIIIDSKYIVRTALVTASDKVILVHNHPSNGLTPSNKDIYLTNITNRLLDAYNIQFLDHIIVAENRIFEYGRDKSHK